MENLLGKWQVIKEETQGMEEFLKAAGLPDEVIELYKKLDYHIETTKEGDDSYKTSIDMSGVGNQSYVWKFGEEFEYKALDGTSPKVTIVKGEDHTLEENYRLPDLNREWKVVRKVEGDIMTASTSSKKGSMTQKLKRA